MTRDETIAEVLRLLPWPLAEKPWQHQRAATAFFLLFKRSANLCAMGCTDAETEFMTPSGWKRIADYADGDKVLQWQESGDTSFVVPDAYVNLPCDKMTRFHNGHVVDMVLSDEHRVPLYDYKKRFVVRSPIELREHPSRYTVPVLFRTGGLTLSRAECRLRVMVAADGTYPKWKGKCLVSVKKERKKVRAREVLQAAGVQYYEKVFASSPGYTSFIFDRPSWAKPLHLSFDWYSADSETLRHMLEELPYWDGLFSHAESRFYTTKRGEADVAQFAAHASGRVCHIQNTRVANALTHRRQVHTVQWAAKDSSPRNTVAFRGDGLQIDAVVPLDGRKYCFSVPSSFWVARRDGKIFVTGNSGKTLSTAWAANILIRSGTVPRALIVAPISIAGHVWERQMKALGLRTVSLCGLPLAQKLAALADKRHQIIIINPDSLKAVKAKLHGEPLVIVDEATAFKSQSSQRSRALRRIATQRIWLLTGTPAPQSPVDALGLIRLLNPASPWSKRSWQDATMQQVTPFKWRPRKEAPTLIARHLQPAFFVPREQCYDVPEWRDEWLDYDLSPEQQKLSNNLIDSARAEFAGQEITAVNAAVLASRLMQIECGGCYCLNGDGERGIMHVPAPDYFARIDSFVEQADTPVLLFAAFRSVAGAVYKHLKAQGHTVGLITGDTKQAERLRLFDAVQAGTLHALVAMPDCAAHGITLTTARYIGWLTPIWKNEHYLQANARIVRPGQTNKCVIAHFVGSKRSKTFFAALKSKESLQTAVLELLK